MFDSPLQVKVHVHHRKKLVLGRKFPRFSKSIKYSSEIWLKDHLKEKNISKLTSNLPSSNNIIF